MTLARFVIRRAGLLTAAVLALPGVAVASTAPSQDPFYAAPASFAKASPGSVLRSRQVTVAFAGSPATVSATQVLYRTTNQLGQPSSTVATILRPAVPVGALKLLSYQTAYDGVADTCRPSYALQDGNSGSNSIVTAESALILSYLNQGYTIVTSDYEGPTDDYGAGREEGTNTLDAIRAGQHQLKLDAKTPTALTGYSGGSIASMWAAQLAPRYAPELNLIGTAAGGIPVDFIHNLAYIDGSSDWAGATPAVGMGLARAYRVNLNRLLGDRGKQIVHEVEKGCLNASAYPGLKFADLFKPRYKDWHKVPELVQVFNDSIMGREATPKTPLLMGVGDRGDGGDGVMVVKDVQQLAHTYCSRGLAVQFHVYNGSDHVASLGRFVPEATSFLQQRFGGQAAGSDCPIAAGNALDPLPTPAGSARLTSGIELGPVRRVAGRYSVLLGAPTSGLTGVTLKVDRLARGHRWIRVGSVAVGDLPSFATRPVALPLGSRGGQSRYRITAAARLQTGTVEASRSFLSPAGHRPRAG